MKSLISNILLTIVYCWYLSTEVIALYIHPDTGLSIEQLIPKYGYPLEIHEVTTEDGYILTMHRIPHGLASKRNSRRPILVMHGLTASADHFVVGGFQNVSLAYTLADNGYDVWLGNARGNMHSRRHKTLKDYQPQFWDFSFHEIGMYDLPAKIDHILKTTGRKKLAYAAHSQGGTVFFVLTTMRPEYNDKISVAGLLAPGVFIRHITEFYPIVQYIGLYHVYLENLAKEINLNEVPPMTTEIRTFILSFCTADDSTFKFCWDVFRWFYHFDDDVDPNCMAVSLASTPNSVAAKQLFHFIQSIHSGGRFQKYDYGPIHNMKMYNNTIPPEYNLANVKTPVGLIYAKDDPTVGYQDCIELSKVLPNVVHNRLIEEPKFRHADFLLNKKAIKLAYEPLLQLLKPRTRY